MEKGHFLKSFTSWDNVKEVDEAHERRVGENIWYLQ